MIGICTFAKKIESHFPDFLSSEKLAIFNSFVFCIALLTLHNSSLLPILPSSISLLLGFPIPTPSLSLRYSTLRLVDETMASGSPSTAASGNESSAAQRLLEQHSSHHVIVETVPDEEDLKHDAVVAAETAAAAPSGPAPSDSPAASWAATQSTKAADKQKESAPAPVAAPAAAPVSKIDTQSHELFPELGAPKKAAATVPIWSVKTGPATNGSTTNGAVANGAASASASAAPRTAGPPSISIPNRGVSSVSLEEHQILPRTSLKRPIPDIIKDLNRKSRANITMLQPSGGRRQFNATGPPEVAQQALRDLVQQIGAKVTVNVTIPQSVRPHIIGKQGSTIKALQEKTGARIQLPKAEDVPAVDDDDATIDVTVEGNALSARAAQDAILKIADERSASVSSHLRNIPAEFYPFIADSRRGILANIEGSGVQIRVPTTGPKSAQPPMPGAPGARPVFTAVADENNIHLSGERVAVQNARAEIEKLAAQLHQQLELDQASITPGRHQFIIGSHGIPMEQFYNETGCVVVLPEDPEDDTVSIVGPADQIANGFNLVSELANGMQCSNYDISRFHRQAPGSAAAHARNVTRYLRQRKEIQRLQNEYHSLINTPFTSEGALPWELYSRDGKNAFRAQTEIKNIVSSHPPSRMASMPVDSFYHQHLRDNVLPRVQEEYGVYLVVPDKNDKSDAGAPLLLVYEGKPEDPSAAYTIPQTVPTPQQIAIYQKGVRDAYQYISEFLASQEDLQTTSLDVPTNLHNRLQKFIKRELESHPTDRPKVRVTSSGTNVKISGPKSSVDELIAKIAAFIEQEIEDDKERGFTLAFDFPKAYANHLIGKGGSNIRELRDKFDVEIQVSDGKVELKGPKAKAEKAKTHILSLGRQFADEATLSVQIEPKFHRELIGAQGSTINRLQTRYHVLIFFPHAAKAPRDDDSAASDAGTKPRRQQAADEVVIRGPKRGAEEAREELMKLYLYLKDTSHTATIEVQQKQVPLLIGKGGSAMDALRQETGAKIDVPNSRGDPESIVEVQLKGTKEQVAAAKKVLEKKKAELDDTVVQTIDVDKKFHKALIGSGGSNIRELVVKAGGSDDRRELSRAIQFPNQDSTDSAIKIEGRRQFVEQLVKQINDFVGERASQVADVIDVPQDKHRSLIGRGGETRRQIESQFNVVVDIPRQGDPRTKVKITGQPADVDKAKEHIKSLIKEQHSTTVQVPRSVHHVISNNGQFFRRLRNENQVTVDHAGHAIPARLAAAAAAAPTNGSLPLITDDEDAAADAHSWRVVEATSTETGEIPWVLHGTPENVEKAKKMIEKALEQSDQSNVTGYLVLPDTRLFRHVVGHAGKKIDSIRKQSGCRIFVPQGKSGQEAIEVVGSKDGVEIAKDLILAAVKEGSQKREQ